MLFLTEEQELKLSKQCIIFYYSSDLSYGIMKKYMYMFSDFNNQVICIDVRAFPKLAKKNNIIQVPTIVIYNDFKETKKITGIISTKIFQQFKTI